MGFGSSQLGFRDASGGVSGVGGQVIGGRVVREPNERCPNCRVGGEWKGG